MKIEILDSVESTNRYCELLDLENVGEFTCYWAHRQTAGIGQRGNHWYSGAPGEALTFSVVLKPTFLAAAEQFKLTQTISLALCDFLSHFTLHLSPLIKWPNDIYVDGGKLCGILTSCRVGGNMLSTAVCGIGLNVNHTAFPEWVPLPTSLRLITGQEYDLEPLLTSLLAALESRYNRLRQGESMEEEYLSRLMLLGKAAHYRYRGEEVTATIKGVDGYGHLLAETADGRQLCCGLKEIEFLQFAVK